MSDATVITTMEVRRDDWSQTRVVEETQGDLAPEEVLLRIDRQALTANNISYAASGDALGYWRFFPAEEGWGRIPAMGWADVVRSNHPEINVGERVWGFFPFSTHLKILGGKVSAGNFKDLSPHREGLAPVYAQFDRASANPIYEPAREDQDSLLRGLFMTSWLVEDFLTVRGQFGASVCLITSASSKTSIALAHCVKQRGAMASVGLTSPRNVGFCEGLGCYDRVLTYDQISSLDTGEPAVMVDMAGSAQVIGDVHRHYRDTLKHSCRIGATHYEDMGPVEGLPGPEPEFFFAPSHLQSRSKELGSGEFMMQLATAYVGFRQFCDVWLQVELSCGPTAIRETYLKVLAGGSDPSSGQMIAMNGEPKS
ncbi:MAG: DUF2855 family protein [Pseudomonadota bacterium]